MTELPSLPTFNIKKEYNDKTIIVGHIPGQGYRFYCRGRLLMKMINRDWALRIISHLQRAGYTVLQAVDND